MYTKSKLFLMISFGCLSSIALHALTNNQIDTLFTDYITNVGYISSNSIGKVISSPYAQTYQQGEDVISGTQWGNTLNTIIATNLNYLFNPYNNLPQPISSTPSKAQVLAAFNAQFPNFNLASFMYAALYSFSDCFGDTQHGYAYNFRMNPTIGRLVQSSTVQTEKSSSSDQNISYPYVNQFAVNANAYTNLVNDLNAFFENYAQELPAAD